MAVVLKGLVCGDKKTGKTSFIESLNGKAFSKYHEVELIDPLSQSKVRFILEESNELIRNSRVVCVFLIYSLTCPESFTAIREKYFPLAQSCLNLSSSFIIIIGTHSDSSNKLANLHEAEEFASSNGAFHIEISSISKRNIELTLKLLRIRAFYLLKKHPELKTIEDEILTTLNTSNSFSHEFPLQLADPSKMQSKSLRYKELDHKLSFDEQLELEERPLAQSLKEEKNMSFADFHENDEMYDLSEDSFDENFNEVGIDTLGSPALPQKVPPLAMKHVQSAGNFPQTERSHEPCPKYLESGSSTERWQTHPLLVLEITFDKCIKKVEVFAEDSAQTVAARALGKNCIDEFIEQLAELIEKAVNEYVAQVKSVGIKKALYKIKIGIGSKTGEIVVHDGDSLENIARNYVEKNRLPKNYEKQILKLLLDAGEKYDSK